MHVSKYYIAKPGGSTHGPFTAEQIAAGCKQGKVTQDMMVCVEGGSDWQPVTVVPGVAFAAATPPAPPAPPAAPPMQYAPPAAPPMQYAAPSSAPAAQFSAQGQYGAAAQPYGGRMASAVPTGPQLPTFHPFAAWSWVICCVGWIWGTIVWFQLCNAINSALGTNRCQGFSMLVPIWGSLHMAEVTDAMNELIANQGLPIQPVQKNMILNFLLPSVPFQSLIAAWNQVAAAANGR
jgi:hypothetical protein